MSPPMRSIGSSSSSGSGGVTKFMKSLYRDEFRWSLVKSVGLFALGIAIARDDSLQFNDREHFREIIRCYGLHQLILACTRKASLSYSPGRQVVKTLKGFCRLFSDLFTFLAWAAWQLQYWPNGPWNMYEIFNQAFLTT